MRLLTIGLLLASLACAEETTYMHSTLHGVEFKVPANWKRVKTEKGSLMVLVSDEGASMALDVRYGKSKAAKEVFEEFEKVMKAGGKDYCRKDVVFLHRFSDSDTLEITYTQKGSKGELKVLLWAFIQPEAMWTIQLTCPCDDFEGLKPLYRELLDGIEVFNAGRETPERTLQTFVRGMTEESPTLFLKSFDAKQHALAMAGEDFNKLSADGQKILLEKIGAMLRRDHAEGMYARYAKGFVRFDELNRSEKTCAMNMISKSAEGKEMAVRIDLALTVEGWRVTSLSDANDAVAK